MDRIVVTPWLTRSRLIALGAAAVFTVTTLVFLLLHGVTRSLVVSRDRIVISTVQVGAFRDYIPLSGNVQPRDTVYLDAVDGGQIVEVLVEAGVMVEAGQALVRLNNTNLQLQVLNSEAQLSEQLNRLTGTKLQFAQSRLTHSRELTDLQFQIEQTTQRLARLRAIVNTGAIKRADVEDAELELRRLQRMRTAAEEAQHTDELLQREQMQQVDHTIAGLDKNLSLARQNLENLVVKASIAGQLTALEAHVGESKSPGQRIGQIDQVDGFKVVAFVDEHYLPRVAIGQAANVEIAGDTQHMEVTKVYPEVRERQFRVDLAFAGAMPRSVRRGQTLQLQLELGVSRKGLLVPNGAFYEGTGGQWVFIVSSSGSQATRRGVKLGRRNPDSVEVLEGLSEGDAVITSSYESLQQFERIELRGDDG